MVRAWHDPRPCADRLGHGHPGFPCYAAPSQGGWSLFLAYPGGYDFASSHYQPAAGNDASAWFGRPDASPGLAELRGEWLATKDESAYKALPRKISLEACHGAVNVPVGGYY